MQRSHFKRRIAISPEQITVNHGDTFVVSDRAAQIVEGHVHGVVHRDTRFVSLYRFSLNRSPLVPLTANQVDYYLVLAHFTNPPLVVPLPSGSELKPGQATVTKVQLDAQFPCNRVVSSGKVHVQLTRQVDTGRVLDEFYITNYDDQPTAFSLFIELKSDFADLFVIRGHVHAPAGTPESVWQPCEHVLVNRYHEGKFSAQLYFVIDRSDSDPVYTGGDIFFPIYLEPKQHWRASVTLHCLIGDSPAPPKREPIEPNGSRTVADGLHDRWHNLSANCRTSNYEVQRAFEEASDDIAACRLYEPDFPPDVWMPTAGVPWFVTVFGRDSEIASLQSLMVYPGLARGTLQKLAHYQGQKEDEWRLEEPGKIMHEIRHGPLATNNEVPHTPYYGTTDATPLYIILLSETWRWTGDRSLLERYLPTAEACLSWIDTYGDHDGDGFLDYWRWVERGLKNQGWKDSGNAIVYPDGRIVPNPITLCEFQGYVYDAKQRMAEIYHALGQPDQAYELHRQAQELQRRFHDAFWMNDEGFIALGLDPEKNEIRSIASNAGHCLWSGIVYPELAPKVVACLLAPDMFCGWGIRTLSSQNSAFNPLDYQVGAVWPHDNSIIAAGMKRYGFADEANRVAKAIFDASAFFQGHRLPELFGGLERTPRSMPVLYPAANIPQAWAAGSIFILLQTILGLRADAANRRLYIDPTLPDWLPDLTLIGLWVGQSRLDLCFTQYGFEVLKGGDEIEVVQA